MAASGAQKMFGATVVSSPRISATQLVQRQLIEAIRRGDLGPDAPFPTEKELCEMFNVSRGSVRDALSGLVATGLIEIQQGKRTSVRAAADKEFAGLFGLYIEFHKEELNELLEVRSALDGLAATKAARRQDAAARERMTAAHDAFVAEVDDDADPAVLKDLDVDFHMAIAQASGGELLPKLLGGLNDLLEWSREIIFTRPEQLQHSVEGHQKILASILDGDPDDARRHASEHLLNMWDWIDDFRSYHPDGVQ